MPERTIYYIKKQGRRFYYLSVRGVLHYDGSGTEMLMPEWKERIQYASRFSNLEEAERLAARFRGYVATA